MTIPLLSTKPFIPPTRPELVSRPQLIEQLNNGLHRKLTPISAPAGFGKTTLVTEWLRTIGGVKPSIAIAWLSLRTKFLELLRWGFWSSKTIESWGEGIHLLQWGFYDQPEPRMAPYRWLAPIFFLFKPIRIFHFQLEKATR